MLKKYILSSLLAFVMLVAVSCHKGGEPVPHFDNSNIASQSENFPQSEIISNQKTDKNSDEPENKKNRSENDGDEDDNKRVVGGDDNEDDDDNGIIGGDGSDDDDDDDGQ